MQVLAHAAGEAVGADADEQQGLADEADMPLEQLLRRYGMVLNQPAAAVAAGSTPVRRRASRQPGGDDSRQPGVDHVGRSDSLTVSRQSGRDHSCQPGDSMVLRQPAAAPAAETTAGSGDNHIPQASSPLASRGATGGDEMSVGKATPSAEVSGGAVADDESPEASRPAKRARIGPVSPKSVREAASMSRQPVTSLAEGPAVGEAAGRLAGSMIRASAATVTAGSAAASAAPPSGSLATLLNDLSGELVTN